MFFVEFFHLTGDLVAVGFQPLDRRLFLGKVARDYKRLRDEIRIRFAVEHGRPAFLHEHVKIVLHGLGPVIHEVLVNIVGIEQSGFAKRFQ